MLAGTRQSSFFGVASKKLATLATAIMPLIKKLVLYMLVTFCIQNATAAPVTAINISVSASFTGTYYGPAGTPAYHGTPANATAKGQVTLYDPRYNPATGQTTVTVNSSNFTLSGPLPPTSASGYVTGSPTALFSSSCVAENYVPCMRITSTAQTGTFPAIDSAFLFLSPGPPSPGTTGSTVFTIAGGGLSLNTEAQANPCCSYTSSVTSGSFTVSPITCGTVISNFPNEIQVGAEPPLSGTGQPTSINGLFRPVDGLTLSQAATLCGYTGWDFQQYVTTLPPYQSPSFTPLGGGPPPSAPFLDPVVGGYTYQGSTPCLAFPFYYDPSSTARTCALTNSQLDASNLLFNDNPQAACDLATYTADGSSCFLPGESFRFSTQIVGILPDGQPSNPLYNWNWMDNYSVSTLTSGGISRLDSGVPVDPGGSGGITILSMGPVDQSSVPEPASGALLVSALAGFGFVLRRKRGLG